MALDLLSIPVMSSEPERIFSLAGLLINSCRSCLKQDVVEASECLNSWERTGLITIGVHHKQLVYDSEEESDNKSAEEDEVEDFIQDWNQSSGELFKGFEVTKSEIDTQNSSQIVPDLIDLIE